MPPSTRPLAANPKGGLLAEAKDEPPKVSSELKGESRPTSKTSGAKKARRAQKKADKEAMLKKESITITTTASLNAAIEECKKKVETVSADFLVGFLTAGWTEERSETLHMLIYLAY